MLYFLRMFTIGTLCQWNQISKKRHAYDFDNDDPRRTVTYIQQKKCGKACILAVYEGCYFSKHSVRRGDKLYWTCSKYQTAKCPSRLVTLNDRVVNNPKPHNHGPMMPF